MSFIADYFNSTWGVIFAIWIGLCLLTAGIIFVIAFISTIKKEFEEED